MNEKNEQLENANAEQQGTPPHGDPLESGVPGSRHGEDATSDALDALPDVPGCPPAPPDGPGRELA